MSIYKLWVIYTSIDSLNHNLEVKTVTIVGTGKWIDFYIFVKVGYYPLLPLACTSIETSLKLMHCLLLYIVYGYPLNLI